ncbi:MAG: pilus assembly PilX family protein [Tepidimonas sp.]|uniref:pilus assembly PilX family protein n=1 Tax=Tepidimonas sp. TaxID=2002775 RepID=UPI00405525AF
MQPRIPQDRHRGIALIVALILLLAITMAGVTTIRTALVEQKLASATYDRNIAFQAAEAALRVAEDRARQHALTNPHIPKMGSDGICDSRVQYNCTTNGICILHDPDCVLRSTDPAVNDWAKVDIDLGTHAGDHPEILIEFLGSDFYCQTPDPSKPNDPSNYCKRYRITARARPASDDRSTVILETLFAAE